MPDELDQLLDEAIRSYAAAEPSPDLAARILRQAQMQAPSSRRGWKLVLAVALPLAVTLTAFVFAGRMNLPAPPAPIASQPPTPSIATPKAPEALAVATSKPAPVRHHVRAARSWARPLPPPYSKEELALLNFVQQHPKEAAEIAEAQEQDVAPLKSQPITISHLEIEPLTIAPLR
jgi:hypothetical protein